MRINKYIAACGVCSRRAAEALVLDGRVQVNGQTVASLTAQVSEQDDVTLDGKTLRLAERQLLYAFHKPVNTLCSHADPHADSFIYDYLPKDTRLFSIGRLDYQSEGLLLVTNDGALAQRLAHPRYETEKEYLVVLDRELTALQQQELCSGILLEGERLRFDRLVADHPDGSDPYLLDSWPPTKNQFCYRGVLHEGKKREIRRMMAYCGRTVERLIRIRIAGLWLCGLRPGAYRLLSEQEKERLYR
ncbi:MAG: pseudouridine synthase [Ndongobacter sp.]|nr:pseudouridine synthase [Ndongobacter sp.]